MAKPRSCDKNEEFLKNFSKELEEKIKRIYQNPNFKLGYQKYKDCHFGFSFGINGVHNNYRFRFNRGRGVTISITVTDNQPLFDFLSRKVNIDVLKNNINEELGVNKNKNVKFKTLTIDYPIDLNIEENRDVTLDWLASTAKILMEVVSEAYESY